MAETRKNMSFALGDHERDFISDKVENGRVGNRTEVVRASLRLMEDYECTQKIQRLRALISEGDADIQAGRTTEYGSAEELFNSITK